MRIVGLDYGDSRIGVAVSDSMGWTAQPVATLAENGWEMQITKILAIIAEYKAEKIVIGMPKNMDGTVGARGEITREFAARLAERSGLPIEEWDERLSSAAAHRVLAEGNVRGKKKKGKVDKIAAVLILQGYLDSHA
ncbi:MAG: Holliday junction resolvase RuvX [Clostridia bacterium]|nr:Holliday junction resolvase RuvX [Clostridia bacterium]